MPSGSFFVLDRAAYSEFVGPSGPVGRDHERRLKTLRYRARGSAGKRTGWLIVQMKYDQYKVPVGLEGRVWSNAPYSLLHHTGTRPHIIRARPGGALRFRVGARVVYARSVNHPGTQPNEYLTRWLKEAVS